MSSDSADADATPPAAAVGGTTGGTARVSGPSMEITSCREDREERQQ